VQLEVAAAIAIAMTVSMAMATAVCGYRAKFNWLEKIVIDKVLVDILRYQN
jgi:hypothetical protein